MYKRLGDTWCRENSDNIVYSYLSTTTFETIKNTYASIRQLHMTKRENNWMSLFAVNIRFLY
jgi:hypothetical protein